eukprot:scaffold376114_cov24-Attheya_sp.AAC.1
MASVRPVGSGWFVAALMAFVPSRIPPSISPSAAAAQAAATASTELGGRKATLMRPGVRSANMQNGPKDNNSSTADPYAPLTRGGNNPNESPP